MRIPVRAGVVFECASAKLPVGCRTASTPCSDPRERCGERSELLYDLRHPNETLVDTRRRPLIERKPLLLWKGFSALRAAIVVPLLVRLFG